MQRPEGTWRGWDTEKGTCLCYICVYVACVRVLRERVCVCGMYISARVWYVCVCCVCECVCYVCEISVYVYKSVT